MTAIYTCCPASTDSLIVSSLPHLPPHAQHPQCATYRCQKRRHVSRMRAAGIAMGQPSAAQPVNSSPSYSTPQHAPAVGLPSFPMSYPLQGRHGLETAALYGIPQSSHQGYAVHQQHRTGQGMYTQGVVQGHYVAGHGQYGMAVQYPVPLREYNIPMTHYTASLGTVQIVGGVSALPPAVSAAAVGSLAECQARFGVGGSSEQPPSPRLSSVRKV